MIIKQFNSLATTPIRKDILTIAEAGYEAISIPTLIGKKLHMEGSLLHINDYSCDIAKFKRIFVVAVGKGSGMICGGLEQLLGANTIHSGVAIDIKHRKLGKIKVFSGTHPLPSDRNILATKKLIKTLQEAGKKDLVIAVICGGGSSLACLPGKNLTCEDLQSVGNHLLKSGAGIAEINTVRKHLSLIHGGNLAKFTYPATVLGLVISDVPGDDLEVVASGPISKDTSTLAQAQAIAKKYKIGKTSMVETPKDDKYFKNVHLEMLANGKTALEGMQKAAKKLGYSVRTFSDSMHGLAKNLGPEMARSVKPNEALLACGESQVVVKHPGLGGRNQDLALVSTDDLPSKSAIVSAASDGKDNIDVAGGLIDSDLAVKKLRQLGQTATAAVEQNKSFHTLSKLNGIYHIHKTTANVSDFVVVLRKG